MIRRQNINLGRLDPKKLHVLFARGASQEILILPRRYTLTHSDITGDLFLTIGPDYNSKQISRIYTHFMRDGILAEWKEDDGESFFLHVYCHISGGFIFGRASWRESIFRSEMPLVLEAIRYGDLKMFAKYTKLDQAGIMKHFRSSKSSLPKIEQWGSPRDYKI
jgi:hypothetical protein